MSENIESRLQRLERLNKALALLVLVMGLLFLIGSSSSPVAETIQSGRFELVGTAGQVQAVLGTDPEGSTGLFVYGPEGVTRLSLTHDQDQSALLVSDGEGTVRIGIAQFAHGGGGVALHGAGSKGAAVLYYKESGSLTFYDEAGDVTTRVNANQD